MYLSCPHDTSLFLLWQKVRLFIGAWWAMTCCWASPEKRRSHVEMVLSWPRATPRSKYWATVDIGLSSMREWIGSPCSLISHTRAHQSVPVVSNNESSKWWTFVQANFDIEAPSPPLWESITLTGSVELRFHNLTKPSSDPDAKWTLSGDIDTELIFELEHSICLRHSFVLLWYTFT